LAACNDRAPPAHAHARRVAAAFRLFPGPGPLARLLRSCPCLRSPRTRTAPAPACMHTLLARTTTRLTENLPLSSSRISYVPHSNASAAHYIYVDGLLLARGSLSLCVRCRGLLWTVRVGGRIGLPQTLFVSSLTPFHPFPFLLVNSFPFYHPHALYFSSMPKRPLLYLACSLAVRLPAPRDAPQGRRGSPPSERGAVAM
jgi:hypothetical protein